MSERSSLRCLLVSYAELGVNSTEHVSAFARGLRAYDCAPYLAVLAPTSGTGFAFFGLSPEAAKTIVPLREEDLPPMDVVHLWTPRGAIWNFLARHRGLVGAARAVILHLEDDEDEILREYTHGKISAQPPPAADALHRLGVNHLSHPILARVLAAVVDGVTVLSPTLAVPHDTPILHILPPLAVGREVPVDEVASLPSSSGAVVFSGGLHAAVADDFLELCRAVGALNREDREIHLVRSGPPALDARIVRRGTRLARRFRDVGYLPNHELRRLLQSAAVLVQPGRPNRYNQGRFPAKLPPYLVSGTPVIMPGMYDWLGLEPRRHALFLNDGSAEEIAERIRELRAMPDRGRAMGARAAAWARERFSPENCCEPLAGFYRSLAARSSSLPLGRAEDPRVTLALHAADQNLNVSPYSSTDLRHYACEEQRRQDERREGPSLWTRVKRALSAS